MSVSNLTNGCKKAILELTQLEVVDLHLACLGRIRVLDDLIMATRDIESKETLELRRERLKGLRTRLEQL